MGLNALVIPENITWIGYRAFESCRNLLSVELSKNVSGIADGAFADCSALTSIIIPSSVNIIGGNLFKGCTNLESITIENGNTKYDSRNNCNAIIETSTNSLIAGCKNTIIPSDVTSIENGAFYENLGITSITIPNSVTKIGRSAFSGCKNLTSITISNGVSAIEYDAFFGCQSLVSATVNWSTPLIIDDDAFRNSNINNATLYVPVGSKAAYEAADNWKEFKEIVEIASASEDTDVSQLTDAVYIESMTGLVGTELSMDIKLKNAQEASAYAFDLVLPEGLTLAQDANGKYIDKQSDRHVDHTRMFNYKGDNVYSFSTLSGNSEPLVGNDGTIRTVMLKIADDIREGAYAIQIRNAQYSNPDGVLVEMQSTTTTVNVENYILGDVSGNGQVDIGDAVSIVNYIVGKPSLNFTEAAADTNKNGMVDIGDAVTIINFIVGKISSFAPQMPLDGNEVEPE